MSVQILATAAEESASNSLTVGQPQQPDARESSVEPATRKQRIKRACDKCSLSRIRCNGQLPCRCRDYDHVCSYAREVKRRGRKQKASQTAQIEGRSTAAVNVLLPTTPAADENNKYAPKRTSVLELSSFHYDAGDAGPELPPGRAATSCWRRYAGHGEHLQGSSSTPSSSILTFATPLPPPSHLLPSDLSSSPSLQHSSPAVACQLFEPLSLHPRCHVGNDGSRVESPVPHGPFSFGAPQSTPPSYLLETIHAAAQINEPSSASPSPSIANSKKTDSDACLYPVITPLLPILADIMPVSVARDLLQLYFDQPGSSLLKCASPYVLTHVVRRRAVLHPSNPRQTSAALLLAMLLATAHTADIAYFHVPGSRTTVCDKLYAAVVGQLRDPDDWHRLLNGGWVMLSNRVQDNSADESEERKDKEKGQVAGPNAGTDEILTIILVTIVLSGGTFKADCLRWWNKAIRLARVLKLAQLDDKNTSDSSQFFSDIEATEEKRRVFWLLFSLDRHLALSYNAPLSILDADISVYLPLPETLWEYLDTRPLPLTYNRVYGPKTIISGTGFFEFFLPLMTVLGDIVLLHHRRLHPRFGALNDAAETAVIEKLLEECECSLKELQSNADEQNSTADTPASLPVTVGSDSHSAERSTSMTRLRLVTAYSTHILHVLAVLLYGKWDPLAMLTASSTSSSSATSVAEDSDDWMNPARFMKCASHAVAASKAVATIITLDPELVFMPYLFGIYLLHGSFILLLFADRMPQLGGPNAEVEQACETVIRAHEVCVVTLSTEFQRSFRRVLRSTLYSVTNIVHSDLEESQARKNALGMYRWSRGGRGLAL
ncbi:transcriptional activator xlnR [Xylogone sp. PMI_703]|nr:transcriptional activator xlnR [Xylogone sp. PMI_703]